MSCHQAIFVDLWVPKTCATCADALQIAVGSSRVSIAGRAGLSPSGDGGDLRPVGLKLIFLIVSWAVSALGLSRQESWWKDAEILMLRGARSGHFISV
jgi:hypothetical protein